MRAALIVLACALGGCATLGDPTPEVRTNTVTVNVPVPVPCFTDADRPKFPTPTPVDVDHATTEQLAAAELADAMAMEDYSRQVDALFIQCQSKGSP